MIWSAASHMILREHNVKLQIVDLWCVFLLRLPLFQHVILILKSLQGVIYVGQLCCRYRFRISRPYIKNWTYKFDIDNECARKTLTFTSNPFSKQKLCKSLVVNYSLQFTACVSSEVPPVRALDSAVQWPELLPIYQWNDLETFVLVFSTKLFWKWGRWKENLPNLDRSVNSLEVSL